MQYNIHFNTPFATITKAYRGDSGEMFVEGIASSTSIDQTQERMSEQAIAKMAARFTGKTLNSEHHNDWDDDLGKIVKSDVIAFQGKPALWIKAKLNDWNSKSRDLFGGLNSGELALGMSVEGKINPGGLVKEMDESVGRYIPVYRDIEPTAVAITNKPANLDTFVGAVAKSMADQKIFVADLPEPEPGAFVVISKVIGAPNKELIKGTSTDIKPGDAGETIKEGNTIACGDQQCVHGACLNKMCKNACMKCLDMAKMDTSTAGGVPESKLARQDLEGGKKKEETTTTEKAVPIADMSLDNDSLNDPKPWDHCTHDYCEHSNCLEAGCPNACAICSGQNPADEELLDGENKLGKAVTGANKTKPKQYKDVPDEKFLDPANFKYPADEKHLPAALRYFNHDGQRAAGGYSESKWAEMGSKLAGLLGEGYHYDSSSEKVEHDKTKKTLDEELIELLNKAVTGANQSKPSEYQDVPKDKFLDPANYKYPADADHLKAALSYFNHSGQRSAGGYTESKWATMGHKLARLLSAHYGKPYHYDASSEQVVSNDTKEDATKSIVKGGDNEMNNHNPGVVQRTPYSPEVLELVKAWGGNNPLNAELFAKASASAGSIADVQKAQMPAQAPAQQAAAGQASTQQTVQKGSSSSSYDSSTSTPSTSTPSTSTDKSTSTGSSSDDTTTDSLSSLLSSVLTTLSDMKSSVSGSSPSSSSDSSTDSSTSTSDKTSTDKAMSLSDATDTTGSDTDDSSYDEATKALSLALANFQNALVKAKKQPKDGNFAENGTQTQAEPKEGKDAVNGKPQEPDETVEAKRKHPMPKAGKPEGQEPDYNSLAGSEPTSTGSSLGKSMANDKFVKSIDTMITLMQKIGEKIEAVEGKVEAIPSVRKGVAIDKQFTEEEKAQVAKSIAERADMEKKLMADPKVTFKELHQFRTYGVLPAAYQTQA